VSDLNKEQRSIMQHAVDNGYYCGDSKDMKILCENGFMESAGRKSFVPDEYFRVTSKGKQACTLSDKPNYTEIPDSSTKRK